VTILPEWPGCRRNPILGTHTLSRLYDNLFEVYGKGGPHVIAQLALPRPRKR